tara:strand:+ start:43 stop:333 length:291 start_codon:yes stop_codon:yes gene_type:complete
MTNLTSNEIDVLNGIAYHEMARSNGSKPAEIDDTGTYCWVDDFSSNGLSGQQVKGVLSSLVKKDLIKVDDYDDDDTVVDFTEAGFSAWQGNDDNRA